MPGDSLSLRDGLRDDKKKAVKKERVVPSRHIPILTKYKPV